jgi:phage gp36-like protein
MAYATIEEFILFCREQESLDISNEFPDLFTNTPFIQNYLDMASARIDSSLAIRFSVPIIPTPPLLKLICIRLAWWEMEILGEIRPQIQEHLEKAEADLKDLTCGEKILIGSDGIKIPATGGDALPNSPPVYSYGVRTSIAYNGKPLRLY